MTINSVNVLAGSSSLPGRFVNGVRYINYFTQGPSQDLNVADGGFVDLFLPDRPINVVDALDFNGSVTGTSVQTNAASSLRLVLDHYESVLNVVFVPSNESTSDWIFVRAESLGPGIAGSASSPDSRKADNGYGDKQYISFADTIFDNDTGPGSKFFGTSIHEIGHALGLNHSFKYDAASPGESNDESFSGVLTTIVDGVVKSTLGDFNLNQSIYTVMSYNEDGITEDGLHHPFENVSLMTLDIAALITKGYGYSQSASNPKNDNYYVDMQSSKMYGHYTIVDNGYNGSAGSNKDTLHALINPAPLSLTYEGGYRIDLRSANLGLTGGSGGYASYKLDGSGPVVTIAHGVVIENAVGSYGSDIIIGNDANNSINGHQGNDSVSGGNGFDDLFISDATSTLTELTSTEIFNLVIDKSESNGFSKTEANGIERFTLGLNDDKIVVGGLFISSYLQNPSKPIIQFYMGEKPSDNDVLNLNSTHGIFHCEYDETGKFFWFENTNIRIYGVDYFIDGINGTVRKLAGLSGIQGEDGSDTFYASADEQYIDGGTGSPEIVVASNSPDIPQADDPDVDTLSYIDSTERVVVNLEHGTGHGGFAEGDTIVNIESLIGSSYADDLTGSNRADTIDGGSENDTIKGGSGNDILNGGEISKANEIDSVVFGGSWQDYSFLFENEDNSTAQVSGYHHIRVSDHRSGSHDGIDIVRNFERFVFNGNGSDAYLLASELLDRAPSIRITSSSSYDASGHSPTLAGSLAELDASDTDKFDRITLTIGPDSSSSFVIDGNRVLYAAGTSLDSYAWFKAVDAVKSSLNPQNLSFLDWVQQNLVLIGDVAIKDSLLSQLKAIAGNPYVATLVATDLAGLSSTLDYVVRFDGTPVFGTNGVDVLLGSDGSDVHFGLDQDDVIKGSAGSDRMVGGDGVDTADYSQSDVGVTVDLMPRSTQHGGAAEGDVLSGIENVIGSGTHANTIVGNEFDNTLQGGAAADVIRGEGGNDIIIYTAGADSLDGGSGYDTLRIDRRYTNGNVNLQYSTVNFEVLDASSTSGIKISGINIDSFRNINFSSITSQSGDIISYTDLSSAGRRFDVGRTITAIDVYNGAGSSASIISIVSDAEQLIATSGNDTIRFSGVATKVRTIDAGAGNADEIGPAQSFTTSLEYSIDSTSSGTSASVNGLNSGTIYISKFEKFIGSRSSDTFSFQNRKWLDTITIDGGLGTDGIAFRKNPLSPSYGSVSIDLASAYQSALKMNIISIEEFKLTDESDSFIGSSASENIWGYGGNDVFDGKGGTDTANYEGLFSRYTITHERNATGVVKIIITDATGREGLDTLVNFERFVFSDRTAFIWSGSGTINGTSTNDILSGSIGGDVMNGLAGDDIFFGSLGADTINGSTGNDAVDYGGSSSAVRIELASSGAQLWGDAEGDILSSIENVVGSVHGDTLIGNDEANVLAGGKGADVIDGRSGIDTADYGRSDSAVDVSSDRTSQIGGDAEGDQLISIEILKGSRFGDTMSVGPGLSAIYGGDGDDTMTIYDADNGWNGRKEIYGEGGNDKIHANFSSYVDPGDGNDEVWAGAANLTIYGSRGTDAMHGYTSFVSTWLDYSKSTEGIGIVLDGTGGRGVTGTFALGDTFDNMDFIIGSTYADTIYGMNTTIRTLINGGAGNDIIEARYAASGGAGNDRIYGLAGIGGNEGNDFIVGGSANQYIDGGTGNDTIEGGGGWDEITLGGGADVLMFRDFGGDSRIYGFGMDDKIRFDSEIVNSFQDVLDHAYNWGGELRIDLGHSGYHPELYAGQQGYLGSVIIGAFGDPSSLTANMFEFI